MLSRDVSCYYCSSSDRSSYREENGYPYVKCDRCGLLYLAPRPAEHLGPLDRGYRHDGPTNFSRRRAGWVRDVLDELSGPLSANATWLDLGARAGETLTAAADLFGPGLLTTGLEPDLRLARTAARQGLEDVTLFDLAKHSTRYDVISAFDIFTRLDNPRISLLRWVDLLMPGGVVYLQAPDTADLASFDQPVAFDPPRNLSFPSQLIVENLLADVGLQIEGIARRPFPARKRWKKKDPRPLNLIFKARAV